MTAEILELMAERRIQKLNLLPYKELNRKIQRKCREAKKQWMSGKCKEIKILQEKHDAFNVYKKVKKMTDRVSKHQITILRDTNNEIILRVEAKL